MALEGLVDRLDELSDRFEQELEQPGRRADQVQSAGPEAPARSRRTVAAAGLCEPRSDRVSARPASGSPPRCPGAHCCATARLSSAPCVVAGCANQVQAQAHKHWLSRGEPVAAPSLRGLRGDRVACAVAAAVAGIPGLARCGASWPKVGRYRSAGVAGTVDRSSRPRHRPGRGRGADRATAAGTQDRAAAQRRPGPGRRLDRAPGPAPPWPCRRWPRHHGTDPPTNATDLAVHTAEHLAAVAARLNPMRVPEPGNASPAPCDGDHASTLTRVVATILRANP